MEQAAHPFGPIDWLIIVAYVGAMIAIGVAASRKQRDTNDFFLAGRSMPAWAVALSVLATSLSAATFIGVPQLAYGGNLTYLILNLGGILAAFLLAWLLVPPLYRAGTVTIYGYLGQRFGPSATMAASVMFLFGRLLASGARLFMAAIAFALILYGETEPRDLVMAVVLLGLIGTLYTACGGIRAVIWTDAIQIVVVVMAALLSVALLLRAIPLSTAEIVAVLRDFDGQDKLQVVDLRWQTGLAYTLWTGLIASTFVSAASYGADHDLAQRLLTARSPWRAGAALIASNLLAVPVVLLFMVIGLLLAIYYGRPDLMGDAAPLDVMDDTKRVFPQFLVNHLPTGFKGLAMAGLFAAALSSFDSAINAMAGAAVADLYGPLRARRHPEAATAEGLHAPRVAVVIMGALLTLFAVGAVFLHARGNQNLIDFALGVMAFASAPLLGVFAAAILTRRGNPSSVFAALAIGAATVLLLQPYMLQAWIDVKIAWPWWWVIVSPLSFAICIAGGRRNG